MWKGKAGRWPGLGRAVAVLLVLAGAVPAQDTSGLAKAACDRAASEGLGKILDAIGIPSDKAGRFMTSEPPICRTRMRRG